MARSLYITHMSIPSTQTQTLIEDKAILYSCMWFKVLMAVQMSMLVFSVVKLCELLGVYRFGGTYCLHLQDWRPSGQEWKLQISGTQCSVDSLKWTDVSEVCTASNIALMMEAVCASETSVYFSDTTRRYIPESCHLNARHRENLKSHAMDKFPL
jgi:hypothetical protein